jgi:hypothetical protein
MTKREQKLLGLDFLVAAALVAIYWGLMGVSIDSAIFPLSLAWLGFHYWMKGVM